MSYIGNTNTTQGFIPAVDFFSGNASTTAFTLSRPVASVAQVQAVIENVPQSPGNAYTISGNTITFTSAPPSGTNNIYVYYTSPITQVIQPGQGTVGPNQLANNYALWNLSGSDINYTAGNVGIGTSSPAQKLHVDGRIAVSGSGYTVNSTNGLVGTYNGAMYVQMPSGGRFEVWRPTTDSALAVDSSGNVGIGTGSPAGKLDILAGTGSAILVAADATNLVSINNYSSASGFQSLKLVGATLQFFTGTAGGGSASEKARITTGGSLLVGTTNANWSTVNHNIVAPTGNSDWAIALGKSDTTASYCYGVRIVYSSAAPNNTGNEFIACSDSSQARFYVRSNGGVANYSANNVNLSDARTKTDIQDASGYLAKICAIPVRTFKYKDQTDDLLNLGVIAQEVEAVAPELVDVSGFGDTPEDGIPLKAIYQTDLQYALMKCIQEQQAIINTLTERITALENK